MDFVAPFHDNIDLAWFGESDLSTLPTDPPAVIFNRIEQGIRIQESQLLSEHMLKYFLAPDNEELAIVYTVDDEYISQGMSGLKIWCFPPSRMRGRDFYTLVSFGLSGTEAKHAVHEYDEDLVGQHPSQAPRTEIICHVPAFWDHLDALNIWPFSFMWSIMTYVIETGYSMEPGVDLPNYEKQGSTFRTRQEGGVRIPFVDGTKMTHALFVSPFEHKDFEYVALEDGTIVNYKQILFLTEKEAQWKEQDFDDFMANLMKRIYEGEQSKIASGPPVDSLLDPFRPCDVEYLLPVQVSSPQTEVDQITETTKISDTDTSSSSALRFGQWATAECYNGQKNKTDNGVHNDSYDEQKTSKNRKAKLSVDGQKTKSLRKFDQEMRTRNSLQKEFSLAPGMWESKIYEIDDFYGDESTVEDLNSPKRPTLPEITTAHYDIIATVHSGRNLVPKDRNLLTRRRTSSDPYVCIYYMSHMFGRTSIVRKTLNPQWGEEGETFSLTVGSSDLEKNKNLEFKIFDYDTLSKDDPMGTAVVTLPSHEPNNKLSKWYEVSTGFGADYCKDATGELLVEVEIRSSTLSQKTLKYKPSYVGLADYFKSRKGSKAKKK